ncbi:sulfatase [Negadavirga shengliensis]|uniref:Sulfatase n=1 Tax=Negadavirga shengliensis TaxID=1389218 RepID=A0ABV9SXR1_9BACT
MKKTNNLASKSYFEILFVLVCMTIVVSNTYSQQSSPNFIFILTDDQGWSCTSMGIDDRIPDSKSDYYETPHIDRMAKEGIRFTNAYAPASICSPTRRSIIFGQTPTRLGDETFKENYNPETNGQALTIPRVLKSANPAYKAAHYGKWDLRADIFPEDLGFDESDGDTRNSHGNLMSASGEKWTEVFVTDDPKRTVSITRRAVNFMERQVDQGNPFYLQISHYAPHVDIQTRRTTLEKYQNKLPGERHHSPGWAGMLEDMDTSVGEILDKVEHLGISDNTYIILMSDNGAAEFIPPVSGQKKLSDPKSFDKPMRNYPLRAGKWTLYEGGIRVPFIVKGPGVEKGKMSHEPVGGWDILPTVAELAGYDLLPRNDLDGGSFAKLIHSGGKGQVHRPRDYFVFHRYHDGYPHSAIIQDNHKLVILWKKARMELYDLHTDIGERTDISGQHPDKVKSLYGKFIGYVNEVNLVLFKKLSAYDMGN